MEKEIKVIIKENEVINVALSGELTHRDIIRAHRAIVVKFRQYHYKLTHQKPKVETLNLGVKANA